jgi:glycosyltransferase involved in cell wall biosynthesis
VKLLTNRPELAQGSAVPVSEIQLGPKLGRRTALRVALGFGPGLARLLRALRAERREGPVDVLLVHFKKEQLMARLVPRSLAPTVVWAEWGPLPLEFRHGLARRLYARAARRARRILAVSENTKRSIVEAGVPEEKVDVLPSIVDAELVAFDPAARERHRREWGASDETFVIACVSRLHPKKRNDVVIDALEHLPEDVLLVVAGSGEGEPELRRRASRFGERVRFIPTPRGHVHEVLSACDVQVFAPQPLEGAPRSIVFGQLTERPVIATAAMGAAEMVLPETGTIVPIEHDARALAACLEEYRVDPDRRAREGAAGRRYALTHHDGRAVGDAVARVVRESHGAGVR